MARPPSLTSPTDDGGHLRATIDGIQNLLAPSSPNLQNRPPKDTLFITYPTRRLACRPSTTKFHTLDAPNTRNIPQWSPRTSRLALRTYIDFIPYFKAARAQPFVYILKDLTHGWNHGKGFSKMRYLKLKISVVSSGGGGEDLLLGSGSVNQHLYGSSRKSGCSCWFTSILECHWLGFLWWVDKYNYLIQIS